MKIKSLIIGLTILGLGQPLLAQESTFKEYADSHSERRYCLYPSTLRMINLKKNEAFQDLASSFDKFLIYQLDSASTADRSYNSMLSNFRKSGYEEYMSILGGGNTVVILGMEKRTNEMTGVVGIEDQLFAFFLKGNVAWQKIPTLIRTMEEDDIFNVFAIKPERLK